MITIYTVTYNEELMIQFMIDHYRTRFPGCRIVIYDNISADNTVKIAKANGCEVILHDTNGQLQDSRYIEIKNHCWKDAKTDWVLVCDLDELLDINSEQLKKEDHLGTSIVRSRGYCMINIKNNLDIAGMKYGVRESGYDKACLFNKRLINDINYSIGCHGCNPTGTITYSKKIYKLYHYMFINEELTVKKFRTYAARLSAENRKYGWGNHYLFPPEQIHEAFAENRQLAVKIR